MKEIEKFKLVERKILLSSLRRYENDAEHSWHLAVFLVLMKDYLPKRANFQRMVKLALIHDLGELYVGDVSLFDTNGREGKDKRELDSAKKLFAKLPKKLGKEMMDLFMEYMEAKTKEAKIVKSLDKIQATIQYNSSKSKNMRKMGLTYKIVDDKKRPYMDHDKNMLKIYELAMLEAKKKGLFASSKKN